MKRGRINSGLAQTFEELTEHRRRAAAVAGLLECCEEADLPDGLLADAAGLIYDELQAVRECADKIREEIRR